MRSRSRAARPLAWAWLLALLVAPLTMASGCAPGFIRIKVTSTSTTNAALPFYMLIRAVDSKNYLAESYSDVAPLVVKPDATVMKAVQVYPGMPVTLWIQPPDKKSVAAYFLFTEPVEPWRMIFEPPVPFTADIELEGSRIRPDAKGTGQPKAKEKE